MKTELKQFKIIRQTIKQDKNAFVIVSNKTNKRIAYFPKNEGKKAFNFINILNKPIKKAENNLLKSIIN